MDAFTGIVSPQGQVSVGPPTWQRGAPVLPPMVSAPPVGALPAGPYLSAASSGAFTPTAWTPPVAGGDVRGGFSFSPMLGSTGGLSFDLPLLSIQKFADNALGFLSSSTINAQGFFSNVQQSANDTVSMATQQSINTAQQGLTLAQTTAMANIGLMGHIADNQLAAANAAQAAQTQRTTTQVNAASSSGGGGCFVTTAVVEYAGMADDCDLLQAMRAFRDEYVQSVEPELVREYYDLAPKIVSRVWALGEKAAGEIWTWCGVILLEALDCIHLGDKPGALKLYVDMVRALEDLVKGK